MTSDERRSIEQDCATLIARYANLNDATRWDELATLFTEDGRTNRPTDPDSWLEGRAAILAGFRARPARKTRHLCTNIVIDAVSPDEAIGESAMALFLPDGVIKVGTFHDRFRRTAEGWRFAERKGALTF